MIPWADKLVLHVKEIQAQPLAPFILIVQTATFRNHYYIDGWTVGAHGGLTAYADNKVVVVLHSEQPWQIVSTDRIEWLPLPESIERSHRAAADEEEFLKRYANPVGVSPSTDLPIGQYA